MGFVLLLLILILLLLLLFVGVKGCNENNHAKSFLMKLSLKMQFKQTLKKGEAGGWSAKQDPQ